MVPTLFGLSAALTACGGGKSSPGQYDLQAGIANLVSQGFMANVVLSGSTMVNGSSESYAGPSTFTLTPGASATFDNTTAFSQTEIIAGTVTDNNGHNTPFSMNIVKYYANSNDAFLGEVKSGTSAEYDVAQSPIDFPTIIGPASAGILGVISRYTDSTMSVSIGTAQLSYSVVNSSGEPGTPLLVNLTTKFYDTSNTLTETDTTSYNLAMDAVLTFEMTQSQTPSGTLVATLPAP